MVEPIHDLKQGIESVLHRTNPLLLLLLQEVVEPIHDLKQGIEDLRCSRTFRYILAMLLNIGNFLNGIQVRNILCVLGGFRSE